MMEMDLPDRADTGGVALCCRQAEIIARHGLDQEKQYQEETCPSLTGTVASLKVARDTAAASTLNPRPQEVPMKRVIFVVLVLVLALPSGRSGPC